MRKKIFINILILNLIVFSWIVQCSQAQDQHTFTTPESFIDHFFKAYNGKNYKNIYRDMASSRIRSSENFADFKESLQKVRNNLGVVKSWDQEYFDDDRKYAAFHFYRLQYRTNHESEDSSFRMVLIDDGGKLFLDGFAIFSAGEILIARGNIYDFEDLDHALLTKREEEVGAWHSMTNENTWKDSANLEEFAKRRKEKYLKAITLASEGKFEEAEELFGTYVRLPEEMNLNLQIIQAVKSGEISKEVGQLIFKADKAFEINEDIDEAIKINNQAIEKAPNFAFTYFLAAFLLLEKEDAPGAWEYIQKGIEIEPDNMYGQIVLTQYYFMIGKPSKVNEQVRKVADHLVDFVPMGEVLIFAGVEKRYYSNGQIAFEATFQDGIAHGSYKGYYLNGALKEEGVYKNGKLDGLGKVYDKNGNVKVEFRYEMSELLYFREYDENGNSIKSFGEKD